MPTPAAKASFLVGSSAVGASACSAVCSVCSAVDEKTLQRTERLGDNNLRPRTGCMASGACGRGLEKDPAISQKELALFSPAASWRPGVFPVGRPQMELAPFTATSHPQTKRFSDTESEHMFDRQPRSK